MATTGAPEHGHTRPNPKLAPFTPDAMKTGARQKDKKNLDYILRSGLAGGVAGCAVCYFLRFFSLILISFIGENSHRSPRPCQNPLPSILSPFRKIHWHPSRSVLSNLRYPTARRHLRAIQGPLRYPSPHLPLRRYKIRRV